MEAISVAVSRGSFVESMHAVHAVAVQDGAVVAEFGDASLTASLRSAAKPFQALPLVRSRDDLTDVDVAIASASHRAEPEQIEAVRGLLAKAPAAEDDLDLGLQQGRPPERIFHNCSGKHAGMLATCRARAWETGGYRLAGHALQDEILAEVASIAAVREDEIATGVDGCGVVCFALPLERVAFMYSRLDARPGGDLVAAAMRAHPQLVGGHGQLDTELMKAAPGWIAKGGAEGLLGAAGPDGVGVALKAVDGNFRALRAAVPLVLAELGLRLDPEFGHAEVRNSRDEVVGEVVVRG